MNHIIYIGLGLLAGAALAVQVVLNGRLRTHLGGPMPATLVSLAVGAAAALAYCLLTRAPAPTKADLAAAPWWAWAGGLLGVVYLWSAVVAAPRVGVAVTFALVIAGQVITSSIIDHFGLLGADPHPATPARLLGALLVVAGVGLMASGR
ncbi:MAG: DMT family transporter [Gemmataceae bacterium]|nr:DMT family transporter [Gemmataceae bacterium]